jgi:protein-S-isoprenylcysteine O-methyltransferase Ste14
MTIGAGLFLIAVGAILRFGISTVSTHGIAIHVIGDILMAVGVLGVLLWLVVWAPWARGRRTTYRRPAPPDEEVVTTRRYPGGSPYDDEYPR